MHFGSATEMLTFFRLLLDRRHCRRIVQGFQRVFAATISFGSEERSEPIPMLDWARLHRRGLGGWS